MYHTNNNPIVITFIDLMIANTRLNKTKKLVKHSEDELRRKRIRLRFYLCVFLSRNPTIIRYRKSDKNDKRIFQNYLVFVEDEKLPTIPRSLMARPLYEEKEFRIPVHTERMIMQDEKSLKIPIGTEKMILHEEKSIKIPEQSLTFDMEQEKPPKVPVGTERISL